MLLGSRGLVLALTPECDKHAAAFYARLKAGRHWFMVLHYLQPSRFRCGGVSRVLLASPVLLPTVINKWYIFTSDVGHHAAAGCDFSSQTRQYAYITQFLTPLGPLHGLRPSGSEVRPWANLAVSFRHWNRRLPQEPVTYSCAKVAAQLPDVYPLGNIEGRVVRALYIDLGEIKYVLDLLPRVPSNIKLYAILRP